MLGYSRAEPISQLTSRRPSVDKGGWVTLVGNQERVARVCAEGNGRSVMVP